jgi:hypothetical protein
MDTLLAQFPYLAMKKKLLHLLETDSRQEAAPFYLAWLANLEWENGNKVYGNIYHYRSLEKMDREKYPLLYLSLLRQKASFAGDMNAGLMIYSILPAYAFYAGIRLPVELSLDSKVGQKSELLLKMQRVWQEYNAGISRGIISPFFYKAGNEEQAFKIFINLKEESHTQKNSTTFRINIEDEIFDRKLDYEMILPGTDEKRLVQAILYRIGLELFGIKFPDF